MLESPLESKQSTDFEGVMMTSGSGKVGERLWTGLRCPFSGSQAQLKIGGSEHEDLLQFSHFVFELKEIFSMEILFKCQTGLLCLN